jgi:hypothetical protein
MIPLGLRQSGLTSRRIAAPMYRNQMFLKSQYIKKIFQPKWYFTLQKQPILQIKLSLIFKNFHTAVHIRRLATDMWHL